MHSCARLRWPSLLWKTILGHCIDHEMLREHVPCVRDCSIFMCTIASCWRVSYLCNSGEVHISPRSSDFLRKLNHSVVYIYLTRLFLTNSRLQIDVHTIYSVQSISSIYSSSLCLSLSLSLSSFLLLSFPFSFLDLGDHPNFCSVTREETSNIIVWEYDKLSASFSELSCSRTRRSSLTTAGWFLRSRWRALWSFSQRTTIRIFHESILDRNEDMYVLRQKQQLLVVTKMRSWIRLSLNMLVCEEYVSNTWRYLSFFMYKREERQLRIPFPFIFSLRVFKEFL